jgi:hypothetical protein
MDAKEILDRIDPVLLREQRRHLLFLARETPLRRERELLNGLIQLTDTIADYIADDLGKPEVLLTTGGQ